MKTNTDLTWYAKTIVNGAESYSRSVINDVAWEDRRAANARLGADVKADDIAVYIPKANGGNGMKSGDVIVKGIVTDVISSSFTITALRAKYPAQAAVVRSVDNMDMGSARMHHWQVGAS